MNIRKLILPGLLLLCAAAMGQTIPSKVLNDWKTFEVDACKPSNKEIICVWAEARPERKGGATDFRVAYTYSGNNGKDWTEKTIIDIPGMMANVNPYITCDEKGETYMVVMHVEPSYFAGQISLYRFDFNSKQFELKSVPAKSNYMLLDKPAISVIGDKIHLVYAGYGEPPALKYQVSNDKGINWTDPCDLATDDDYPFLGPSAVEGKNKEVWIGCGSYGKDGMYLYKAIEGATGVGFHEPVVVSPKGIPSGMSEMMRDPHHGILMTWQPNHSPGEVYIAISKDEGNTWSAAHEVSSSGNLLSAAFDQNGNIHCIYSEYKSQQYAVEHIEFGKEFKVVSRHWLRGPEKRRNEDGEYIGAYQKLIIQGNWKYAFWIDYTKESRLQFARWKR